MTTKVPDAMIALTSGTDGASDVLLGTATASGSSSVSITNIPAGYDQYELRYSNVIPSASGANLYLSQSENNGSSWLTSSWQGEGFYCNSGGGSGILSNPASVGLQISNNTSNTANQGATGKCLMSSLGSTSLFKIMFFYTSWGTQMSWGGGFYNGDTGAVNALQIVPSTGTMSGKFALYGKRNS